VGNEGLGLMGVSPGKVMKDSGEVEIGDECEGGRVIGNAKV
jgi:hypothetical protein